MCSIYEATGDHQKDFLTPQNINDLPIGSDIPFPIGYGPNPPFRQYERQAYKVLSSRDLAGNNSTLLGGGKPNPKVLDEHRVHIDWIIHSSGLFSSGHEIANSEVTQSGGIKKFGSPLAATDSRNASDHFAVVADFSFQSQ